MTGFTAQNTQYDGSVIVVSWGVANGSVKLQTRFGGYGSQTIFGGGIDYDPVNNLLYVSGATQGTNALYGGQDGFVLSYYMNWTLRDSMVIGSAGPDSAAAISLPYVCLTLPSNSAAQFGALKGPAIMSISGAVAGVVQ